jgi:hypothetical protein
LPDGIFLYLNRERFSIFKADYFASCSIFKLLLLHKSLRSKFCSVFCFM